MTTETLNGAMIFDTPDAMIAAMFGAPQNDRHVQRYRQHQFLAAQMAAYDLGDACVRKLLASKRVAS